MHREPLEYDAFFAHRQVSRVHGALPGGARTAIEKVTAGPGLADPYLYDNALREFAAYTVGSRPLSGDDLLAAAHDLGGMAGYFLGRVPQHPWLFTGWITRHSQPGAWAEGTDVLTRSGSPALRLIAAQGEFRRVLERLPVTLCHHDAVGSNVFRTDAGTVLIDWESVGPGAIAADLASLLFASARRGDASAHVVREVMPDAVAAYASGLGGRVPVAVVQRALDAAIGLRWKLARDLAATLEAGDPARRGSAPHETPETALDELTTLARLLLESAERILGHD